MEKSWSILFGVVLGASLLLFIVAPFVGWWLPASVCSYGPGIYLLFYVVLGVTGFFFVLTEALLVYNMWAFVHVPGRKAEYVHGNHKLEMFWTAVPGVLLFVLALSQIPIWHKIKSTLPGEDVQVMEVSARQFEWRVRYPSAERMSESNLPETFAKEAQKHDKHADDVFVVNEIHVWKGAKVRVALKTRDVLHSFFLPNIPTKQDAVPGKTITVWFDANEHNCAWNAMTGKWEEIDNKIWELACAELCGWGHYKMRGKLYVHQDKEDFLRWLNQTAAELHRTTAEK